MKEWRSTSSDASKDADEWSAPGNSGNGITYIEKMIYASVLNEWESRDGSCRSDEGCDATTSWVNLRNLSFLYLISDRRPIIVSWVDCWRSMRRLFSFHFHSSIHCAPTNLQWEDSPSWKDPRLTTLHQLEKNALCSFFHLSTNLLESTDLVRIVSLREPRRRIESVPEYRCAIHSRFGWDNDVEF